MLCAGINIPSKVCSPLLAVENTKGKLRLVIDLRYVNQFLNQHKFKYEGLDLISSFREILFSPLTLNLVIITLISTKSQPYLGFSWGEGLKKNFIFFVCSHLVCHLLAMCLPSALDLW